jgi:hypothetical protein
MLRTVDTRCDLRDCRVLGLALLITTKLTQRRPHRLTPGAGAYYDRRKTVGDRHAAAQRHIFNRLLGCLHYCLATSRHYDEITAFPPPATSPLDNKPHRMSRSGAASMAILRIVGDSRQDADLLDGACQRHHR